VDQAAEILTRYSAYWDGQNNLIYDRNGYALALDKPSRGKPALRRQNAAGVVYINGQSSIDDDMEAYIRRQRQLYLKKTKQLDISAEANYFRFSENVRTNMIRRMEEFSRMLTLENLIEHMSSGDPDGPLCKRGVQHHPDDPIREATNFQVLACLDQRRAMQRQWEGGEGNWTPVWEQPWTEVSW